jgi:hypothetical protein
MYSTATAKATVWERNVVEEEEEEEEREGRREREREERRKETRRKEKRSKELRPGEGEEGVCDVKTKAPSWAASWWVEATQGGRSAGAAAPLVQLAIGWARPCVVFLASIPFSRSGAAGPATTRHATYIALLQHQHQLPHDLSFLFLHSGPCHSFFRDHPLGSCTHLHRNLDQARYLLLRIVLPRFRACCAWPWIQHTLHPTVHRPLSAVCCLLSAVCCLLSAVCSPTPALATRSPLHT